MATEQKSSAQPQKTAPKKSAKNTSATRNQSEKKTGAEKSSAAKTTTMKATTKKTTTSMSSPAKTSGTKSTAGKSAANQPTSRPHVAVRQLPAKAVSSVGHTARAATELASGPMSSARRVLDRGGGLPVYAGAGALAVFGAIEWPVAIGVGAGYAALRRWGSRLPEPLRSLTGSR